MYIDKQKIITIAYYSLFSLWFIGVVYGFSFFEGENKTDTTKEVRNISELRTQQAELDYQLQEAKLEEKIARQQLDAWVASGNVLRQERLLIETQIAEIINAPLNDAQDVGL